MAGSLQPHSIDTNPSSGCLQKCRSGPGPRRTILVRLPRRIASI